jgi:hypothetical protein
VLERRRRLCRKLSVQRRERERPRKLNEESRFKIPFAIRFIIIKSPLERLFTSKGSGYLIVTMFAEEPEDGTTLFDGGLVEV